MLAFLPHVCSEKTRHFFFHQGDWIPRWWKKVTFYFPPLSSSFCCHRAMLIFTEVNLVSTFFSPSLRVFSGRWDFTRKRPADEAAKDKVYTLECLFSFPFHLFFSTSSFYVYRGDSRRPAISTASLAVAAAAETSQLLMRWRRRRRHSAVLLQRNIVGTLCSGSAPSLLFHFCVRKRQPGQIFVQGTIKQGTSLSLGFSFFYPPLPASPFDIHFRMWRRLRRCGCS